MTPHIKAKAGEFAKTVLMPGDPLRAKWIAETFLQDARLVNEVRGMLGYTGTYKGKPVSVMAHGMGIPSIGIYSFELFKFYGVENIIRIGSAGAYDARLQLGDVILGEDAFSESSYPALLGIKTDHGVLRATPALAEHFKQTARKTGVALAVGRIHAEDCFYGIDSLEQRIKKTGGALAVEMEATGLYANALFHKRNALVLLTVSDSLVTHAAMSPEARQTSFGKMVTLALEGAVTL